MSEKPNYYAIVPANVRYDKELKAAEKILYAEITALSNSNGYCFATNTYFANLYSVDKRSICRWIGNLCEKGYIYSEVIYENKVVKERRLYINNNCKGIDKNVPSPHDKKVVRGIDKDVTNPHDRNVADNITSINTTSINNIYSQIYDYWNSKDIKNHKKLSMTIQKAIDKVLKEYTVEEILEAINNYETVYKDDNYYYSWTWSLEKFLKQKNGVNNFVKDGDLYINYINSRNDKSTSQKRGASNATGYVFPRKKNREDATTREEYKDLDI